MTLSFEGALIAIACQVCFKVVKTIHFAKAQDIWLMSLNLLELDAMAVTMAVTMGHLWVTYGHLLSPQSVDICGCNWFSCVVDQLWLHKIDSCAFNLAFQIVLDIADRLMMTHRRVKKNHCPSSRSSMSLARRISQRKCSGSQRKPRCMLRRGALLAKQSAKTFLVSPTVMSWKCCDIG